MVSGSADPRSGTAVWRRRGGKGKSEARGRGKSITGRMLHWSYSVVSSLLLALISTLYKDTPYTFETDEKTVSFRSALLFAIYY